MIASFIFKHYFAFNECITYKSRHTDILFARYFTELQHQLLFGSNSKTVIKINGVIYRQLVVNIAMHAHVIFCLKQRHDE